MTESMLKEQSKIKEIATYLVNESKANKVIDYDGVNITQDNIIEIDFWRSCPHAFAEAALVDCKQVKQTSVSFDDVVEKIKDICKQNPQLIFIQSNSNYYGGMWGVTIKHYIKVLYVDDESCRYNINHEKLYIGQMVQHIKTYKLGIIVGFNKDKLKLKYLDGNDGLVKSSSVNLYNE